jgi:preprotein translocase SecE subunit
VAKSTKKNTPAKSAKSSTSTKVTRISASDSRPKPAKKAPAKSHALTSKEKADITENKPMKSWKSRFTKAEVDEQMREKQSGRKRRPLRAMSEYFRGAWYELRQVRWPDRATTWQMTGALIGFTVFIAVVILLLDALFKYLFELMIGK